MCEQFYRYARKENQGSEVNIFSLMVVVVSWSSKRILPTTENDVPIDHFFQSKVVVAM